MIGLKEKRRGRLGGKANVEVKNGGNGAATRPLKSGILSAWEQRLIRGKEGGERNIAAHVKLYFHHLQNTLDQLLDFRFGCHFTSDRFYIHLVYVRPYLYSSSLYPADFSPGRSQIYPF